MCFQGSWIQFGNKHKLHYNYDVHVRVYILLLDNLACDSVKYTLSYFIMAAWSIMVYKANENISTSYIESTQFASFGDIII